MTTATIDRTDEPFIGIYRRSANCEIRWTGAAATEPNYLARRLGAAVVVVLAVFIVAVGANGLLAGFGGGPAAAAEASPALDAVAETPRRHVARAGDTMWSIASTHRGDVSHGRYLDALIRLNGGVQIQVGQAVALP